MTIEYKVIPAPTRGQKARGVKGPAARFANAMEQVINAQAKEGWTYLRAETLPSEEREGLMGRTTVFQNVLVFQRAPETPANFAPPVFLPLEREAGDAPALTAEPPVTTEPEVADAVEETPEEETSAEDTADDSGEGEDAPATEDEQPK